MTNTVTFEGLGLSVPVTRVALSFLGINIYWYGIIIVAAVFSALLVALKNIKKVGITDDMLYDFLLWAIPVSVIGARLYYVIYKFGDYRGDLIKVLYIWEGGIAIYGALIGAFISLLAYCFLKKIPAYDMLDALSPTFILGQAIGRWGNFFNKEAYGSSCGNIFRMSFYDDRLGEYITNCHPTFLYESAWNLAGFFILMIIYKRFRRFRGIVFYAFVLWYGLGRFFIEQLRTDSLMLGNMRVSALVAAVTALLSVFIIAYRLLTITSAKSK